MQIFIGIWVFIIGACIGSFLNVVIIRGLKNEQFVKGPSHCTTCDYILKWYDNIPIISYIILGGKCRNCHKHISLQYPIVEALTAIAWLLIYLRLGLNIKAILYMIVTASMIVISVVDIKIQEIPSTHQLIILICGIINLATGGIAIKSAIAGLLTIPALLLIMFIIVLFVFSIESIGMGDIKLEAVIGLLIGLKPAVTSFYLGCIVALIVHSLLRIIKVKGFETNRLPFGPYLCFGAYIAMLYGTEIADKALTLMGY